MLSPAQRYSRLQTILKSFFEKAAQTESAYWPFHRQSSAPFWHHAAAPSSPARHEGLGIFSLTIRYSFLGMIFHETSNSLLA
jgi:hypothetical protein